MSKAFTLPILNLMICLTLIFFGCEEQAKPVHEPVQEKAIRVGLQPYANFDTDLIGDVKGAIDSAFGFEVVKMEGMEMPQSAFVQIKSPRYRADSMLRILRRNKPMDLDYVMGLTSSDISTTKREANGAVKTPVNKYGDWGIFGYGFRPGPASIVSTFRLGTSNEELLRKRLRKICLHELGHNLGLPHCTSGENCLMRDAAETIRTIDEVDERLCQFCHLALEGT